MHHTDSFLQAKRFSCLRNAFQLPRRCRLPQVQLPRTPIPTDLSTVAYMPPMRPAYDAAAVHVLLLLLLQLPRLCSHRCSLPALTPQSPCILSSCKPPHCRLPAHTHWLQDKQRSMRIWRDNVLGHHIMLSDCLGLQDLLNICCVDGKRLQATSVCCPALLRRQPILLVDFKAAAADTYAHQKDRTGSHPIAALQQTAITRVLLLKLLHWACQACLLVYQAACRAQCPCSLTKRTGICLTHTHRSTLALQSKCHVPLYQVVVQQSRVWMQMLCCWAMLPGAPCSAAAVIAEVCCAESRLGVQSHFALPCLHQAGPGVCFFLFL
jgi:hypothetical protein